MKKRQKTNLKSRSKSRVSNLTHRNLFAIILVLLITFSLSVINITEVRFLDKKSDKNNAVNIDPLEIIESRFIDRISEANVELNRQLQKNISSIILSSGDKVYSDIAQNVIRLVTSDWLSRNNFKDVHEIHSRINDLNYKINAIEIESADLNKKTSLLESSIKMFEEKRGQYSYLDPSLLGKYNEIINSKKSELELIKNQLSEKKSGVIELKEGVSKVIKERNRIKFIESTLIYEINDKMDYDIWSFDDYSLSPHTSRLKYIETLQKGSTNFYAASSKTVEDFEKDFLEDRL